MDVWEVPPSSRSGLDRGFLMDVGPTRAKKCRLPVLWFGEDEKRAADFLTTTVTGQGIY
jgi:hypothetical protein